MLLFSPPRSGIGVLEHFVSSPFPIMPWGRGAILSFARFDLAVLSWVPYVLFGVSFYLVVLLCVAAVWPCIWLDEFELYLGGCVLACIPD